MLIVNSETKLSTREECVPHGHPMIIRPEGAKIIGSNEAFPSRVKNSFQKIMKLVFKWGVWKASIKDFSSILLRNTRLMAALRNLFAFLVSVDVVYCRHARKSYLTSTETRCQL